MKSLILCVAFLSLGAAAEASSIFSNVFEFNAPVVGDRTSLSEVSAGTIVYDAGSGAFFGLPSGFTPTTGSHWIQLGGTTTGNPIVSGGLERSERAIIANNGSASITSQSGSWISSVSRTAQGQVAITLAASMFSSAPTCVASPVSGGSSYTVVISSTSTSTVNINEWTPSTGSASDVDFHIICMGAR